MTSTYGLGKLKFKELQQTHEDCQNRDFNTARNM